MLIETFKTEMKNNKVIVAYFQLTCKLNNQKTIFVYNDYHWHFSTLTLEALEWRGNGGWRSKNYLCAIIVMNNA